MVAAVVAALSPSAALQPTLPQQQDTTTTHNPHCHSRALTLQLQELTSTSLPHDRGQDAISPLIGVEVKFPVQLAQGQRLGVQWELLQNKGQRSVETPTQQGSEVSGNTCTTRVRGQWELLHNKGQRSVGIPAQQGSEECMGSVGTPAQQGSEVGGNSCTKVRGQWELLHNKCQRSAWGQWELLHNNGQRSVWGQWELPHKCQRSVWGQWELLHNKVQRSVWGQWEFMHNRG